MHDYHLGQLGLTWVVERKNYYPPYPGSNPTSDMFALREPIVVEALHEPRGYLTLAYGLEGEVHLYI